jgi:hypothetical protein
MTLPGGDLLAAAAVGERLLLWRSTGGAAWTAEAVPAGLSATVDSVAVAAGAGRTVLAVSTAYRPRAWSTC